MILYRKPPFVSHHLSCADYSDHYWGMPRKFSLYYTQMLHVWNIYLHLGKFRINVGKYSIHGASGIYYSLYYIIYNKGKGFIEKPQASSALWLANTLRVRLPKSAREWLCFAVFDVIGGESLEFWVSLKDGKGYIMVCIYIYILQMEILMGKIIIIIP